MRNTRGELTEGCHLFGMDQALLGFAECHQGLFSLLPRRFGCLLGQLELGDLREYANRAARLGLALTDLNPAPVALRLQVRCTWMPMLLQSVLNPIFGPAGRVGDDAPLGDNPDDALE